MCSSQGKLKIQWFCILLIYREQDTINPNWTCRDKAELWWIAPLAPKTRNEFQHQWLIPLNIFLHYSVSKFMQFSAVSALNALLSSIYWEHKNTFYLPVSERTLNAKIMPSSKCLLDLFWMATLNDAGRITFSNGTSSKTFKVINIGDNIESNFSATDHSF